MFLIFFVVTVMLELCINLCIMLNCCCGCSASSFAYEPYIFVHFPVLQVCKSDSKTFEVTIAYVYNILYTYNKCNENSYANKVCYFIFRLGMVF